MRWEAERLEGTVLLATVLLGLVLLAGASVQHWRGEREETLLAGSFATLCSDLGFLPTTAEVPQPQFWCGGTVGKTPDSPPVLLHWYLGSPGNPGVKGIAATMPVGVMEGGGWGVELEAGRARYWGDGPGEAELRALLPQKVLELGARIPVGALMPMDRVNPGSELARVIDAQWPGGWKGLAIRGLLGRVSRKEQTQQTLLQMLNFRAALRGEPYQELLLNPPPRRP